MKLRVWWLVGCSSIGTPPHRSSTGNDFKTHQAVLQAARSRAAIRAAFWTDSAAGDLALATAVGLELYRSASGAPTLGRVAPLHWASAPHVSCRAVRSIVLADVQPLVTILAHTLAVVPETLVCGNLQHPRRRRRPRAPGDTAPRCGLGRVVGRHARGAAGHGRCLVPGALRVEVRSQRLRCFRELHLLQ